MFICNGVIIQIFGYKIHRMGKTVQNLIAFCCLFNPISKLWYKLVILANSSHWTLNFNSVPALMAVCVWRKTDIKFPKPLIFINKQKQQKCWNNLQSIFSNTSSLSEQKSYFSCIQLSKFGVEIPYSNFIFGTISILNL